MSSVNNQQFSHNVQKVKYLTMQLIIKAIRYKGQPIEPPLTARFNQEGGSLGRSPENHLVLPDVEKVVSGKHAFIEYENGNYYYLDESLNGTGISSRNLRIHNEKIKLDDRDELQIGDYDLVLTISGHVSGALTDQKDSEEEDSIFAFLDPSRPPEKTSQDPDKHEIEHTSDVFSFKQDADSARHRRNDSGKAIDASFVPPQPKASPIEKTEIPDNLSLDDFFGEPAQHSESSTDLEFFNRPPNEDHQVADQSIQLNGPFAESQHPDISIESRNKSGMGEPRAESQTPKPDADLEPVAAGQMSVSEDLLDIFFKSAGIDNPDNIAKEEIPDMVQKVGTVFRELIEGLMTILRGRMELKSQFRVSMTILKPAENNPLKFSPTVNEALKLLLTNHHPGFLDAVEAVRQGYDDIKNHQMAINAGVQASLVKTLRRFDPQQFAHKYEEGFVFQKKAKCWDEYCRIYPEIVEQALQEFFGNEFVSAYEQQMEKLRDIDKKG